jgi:molybdenum cofactor biosynthesis enzyme MoaA
MCLRTKPTNFQNTSLLRRFRIPLLKFKNNIKNQGDFIMLNKTKYLRISVCDVCNFSCYYCHCEGITEKPAEWLTVDDIVFICKTAKNLGFEKFKLTGGEPTLREDLPLLILKLTNEADIENLSMITNGVSLEYTAKTLKSAGLKRLNVSLNTLNDGRHTEINRNKNVAMPDKIIKGIDTAIELGYEDIKINFVYINGESDEDLKELLDFTLSRSLTLVLLPLIDSSENPKTFFSLEMMYDKLKKIGIKNEADDFDNEGIARKSVVLKTGNKILLRCGELGNYNPFIFCEKCAERKNCREGIFPLRLSPYGELIPCAFSKKNRIDIRKAIKERHDSKAAEAIKTIWDWQV